jgi:hypothetical protein
MHVAVDSVASGEYHQRQYIAGCCLCCAAQDQSLSPVMVAGSWLGLSLCPAVQTALQAAAPLSMPLSTLQHTPAPGRSTAR